MNFEALLTLKHAFVQESICTCPYETYQRQFIRSLFYVFFLLKVAEEVDSTPEAVEAV